MKNMVPDKDMCREVASVLKTLSHPERLYILCKLYKNELTVSELEKSCDSSQPLISQHLTRMRLEGLVESKREGNFVYYSIANPRIQLLLESLERVFPRTP